ncbi:sensor histidine kinase [Leifsonia poae]|uniref:histidine kinase n=1 Tax=Leifsonia poae TaxID=110933 RepID=A0A9W6LZS0_9MICO|nr:HAMP domain-containing sensor histidine kinase [Leifsonia poae]GLJ76543.1 two-component sensor histidine kinase [Leifsonia poae]
MTASDDQEMRTAARRLAIQFAAIILVLFALLGVVIVVVVSTGQAEAAKRTLADASMIDSVHDAPSNLLITVVPLTGDNSSTAPENDGDPGQGRQSSPRMPAGLPDEAAIARVARGGPPESESIDAGGQSYLTQTDVRRGKVVQISYGLGEQKEELTRLLVALVISGAIAAVLAAGVGVFIARRAMRPLADALALQRRFVADASHELRTPLTLLSTRAQLLRRRIRGSDSPIPQPVITGADELVDDSKALTEIVEDLLTAADPRQDAESERVDLGELAATVAAAIQGRAHERGVAVTASHTGNPIVAGASVSLRRMIVALVDNAVDHAASTVTIECTREHDEVVVAVSDDGPGFTVGSERRVFERFASARAESDEHTSRRHYGLGLALVLEVVTRHGGVVTATNDGPDGGGQVTVRMPAVP